LVKVVSGVVGGGLVVELPLLPQAARVMTMISKRKRCIILCGIRREARFEAHFPVMYQ